MSAPIFTLHSDSFMDSLPMQAASRSSAATFFSMKASAAPGSCAAARGCLAAGPASSSAIFSASSASLDSAFPDAGFLLVWQARASSRARRPTSAAPSRPHQTWCLAFGRSQADSNDFRVSRTSLISLSIIVQSAFHILSSLQSRGAGGGCTCLTASRSSMRCEVMSALASCAALSSHSASEPALGCLRSCFRESSCTRQKKGFASRMRRSFHR
mmetsp:Transcript_51825/g.139718  ORF Transcript_51825/g.139718 Transcript_51825/m.139718 type:complete len:214 (-) Transcript_51825:947-1588(-)